jgi:hypothetical protein
MTGKTSVAKQLRFSGFSHMSLPCRDLAESKRFYMDVMGGELVHDVPGFAEVRIADVIIGISQQVEGWTPWNAEFPHYAFFWSMPRIFCRWSIGSAKMASRPLSLGPAMELKDFCTFATLQVISLKCIALKSKRPRRLPEEGNKAEITKLTSRH